MTPFDATLFDVPQFDARTEKNIATLTPKAQVLARQFMEQAIKELWGHGITVKIISGTRSYADQNALYAQGRTKPGPKVTNAKGGYSNHNFGIAFDIGLFKGSKYLGESPSYKRCGFIGETIGLEWGGRWRTFTDEPHFQLKTGLTLAQMRDRIAAGKPIV